MMLTIFCFVVAIIFAAMAIVMTTVTMRGHGDQLDSLVLVVSIGMVVWSIYVMATTPAVIVAT